MFKLSTSFLLNIVGLESESNKVWPIYFATQMAKQNRNSDFEILCALLNKSSILQNSKEYYLIGMKQLNCSCTYTTSDYRLCARLCARLQSHTYINVC
jgi:hypothetical protein